MKIKGIWVCIIVDAKIFSFFFRVVQKNLVFVVGLTQRLADPEVRLVCYMYVSVALNSDKIAINNFYFNKFL